MEKITFDFKDRTAIVTGGAQGFGFDITKRFLKSGAKVIIWDNDSKAIESAIKEIDNPNLSSPILSMYLITMKLKKMLSRLQKILILIF